jgi:ubiquinone biosynthesis protein UbiJ
MVGDLGGDLVLRGLAEGERDSFGERVSEVDDLAEAVTEEEPVVLRDGMGE